MSEMKTIMFPGDKEPREVVDAKARSRLSRLPVSVADQLGSGTPDIPIDLSVLEITDHTTLYFAKGTYYVQPLDLNGIQNITILMHDAELILIGDYFITARDCPNFRAVGGKIDGNSNAIRSILLINSQNSKFEGVTFCNNGSAEREDVSMLSLFGDCSGFSVDQCIFDGSTAGVVGADGFIHAFGMFVNRLSSTQAYSKTGIVERCVFNNIAGIDTADQKADGDGIFIQAPIYEQDGELFYPDCKVLIDQCTFTNCKKRGVKVAARGVEIRKSVFEGEFWYACADFQYGYGSVYGCRMINTSSYNGSVTSALVANEGGLRVERCYLSAPYTRTDADTGETYTAYHPGIRFTSRQGFLLGTEVPWGKIIINDCWFDQCSRAVYAYHSTGKVDGYTLAGMEITNCQFGKCNQEHVVELYNSVFATIESFVFTDFRFASGSTRQAVQAENGGFIYPFESDCNFTLAFELYSRHWNDDPMSGYNNLPTAAHTRIIYTGANHGHISFKEYTSHGSVIVGDVNPNNMTGTLAKQLMYNSRVGDRFFNTATGDIYRCTAAGTDSTVGTWAVVGSGGSSGGTVTDAQVETAVSAYMEANPVADGQSIYFLDKEVTASDFSTISYDVSTVTTNDRSLQIGDLLISNNGVLLKVNAINTTTKKFTASPLVQLVPEITIARSDGGIPAVGIEPERAGVIIESTVNHPDGSQTTWSGTVYDGLDGETPVKGVDYFTEDEIQAIAEQAAQLVEVPDSPQSVVTPEIVGTTAGGKATAFSYLMYGTDEIESFTFFTDPHLLNVTNNETQMREYLDTLKLYHDVTPTSFVIGGGDWYGNSDTREMACFKLGYIDGWMRRLFGERYYLAVGNHDTNQQGVDETGGTWTGILPKETVRNLWFRERGNTYYAFDGANTRFYVLDTWKEGTDAANYWEQIAWLGERLKTDNPTNAALVMHIGYYPSGESYAVDTLAANALALSEAFNNSTSITLNGVTYDFAGCTGTVRFALSGHIHADHATIVNGIPLIATTDMRAGNTPTFDLCLADYGANKLHLVRVGTGEDRTFTMGPDGAILDGNAASYTNLVPTSTVAVDSTEIYEGVGYADDAFVTDGFGTAEGYVAIGYLPLKKTDVIYIKGAELTGDDYVRLYVFTTSGAAKCYCKAPSVSDGNFADTAGTQRFTIEQLGELYYRLTPIQSVLDDFMYYRISLKGTGENLIITHNEPILQESEEVPSLPITFDIEDPIVFLAQCNHNGGSINYYDRTVRSLIVTTENTGAVFAVGSGTTDTTHYATVVPDGATSITVNCGDDLMWAMDAVNANGVQIADVTGRWVASGETVELTAMVGAYYLIKLKKADDSAFAADYDASRITWTFA